MIGFVTWPPFCTTAYVKGGQVTKPIMHGCEIASYPVELLCACLLSKSIYNKQLHCTQTSWPYLISELLVADLFTMLFLLGLAIFLHPGCFCLAYLLTCKMPILKLCFQHTALPIFAQLSYLNIALSL